MPGNRDHKSGDADGPTAIDQTLPLEMAGLAQSSNDTDPEIDEHLAPTARNRALHGIRMPDPDNADPSATKLAKRLLNAAAARRGSVRPRAPTAASATQAEIRPAGRRLQASLGLTHAEIRRSVRAAPSASPRPAAEPASPVNSPAGVPLRYDAPSSGVQWIVSVAVMMSCVTTLVSLATMAVVISSFRAVPHERASTPPAAPTVVQPTVNVSPHAPPPGSAAQAEGSPRGSPEAGGGPKRALPGSRPAAPSPAASQGARNAFEGPDLPRL